MDPFTGLPTLRHDLSIDRGMSFEAAAARLAHERSGAPAPVCRMGQLMGALSYQPQLPLLCTTARLVQHSSFVKHNSFAPLPGPSDRSGFRASRRPMFGRTTYLLALQKPGAHNVFAICRPNTGGR